VDHTKFPIKQGVNHTKFPIKQAVLRRPGTNCRAKYDGRKV